MNVYTTVQEKDVAFPTDSKLLDAMRRQVVKLPEANGIRLRQNYNRTAKTYRLKISRYAYAKQYGALMIFIRQEHFSTDFLNIPDLI